MGWLECEGCGWKIHPDEGVCSNPACDLGPVAKPLPGRDPGEPSAESKQAVLDATREREYNRAARRGNFVGRGVKHAPPPAPPPTFAPDELTPALRAERRRNDAERDQRRRAKVRKRRHDQRIGRKKTR